MHTAEKLLFSGFECCVWRLALQTDRKNWRFESESS